MSELILMTPDQAVCALAKWHPSLYASTSFENSKFMIFDQIFNTIGSGFRYYTDFAAKMSVTADVIDSLPSKDEERYFVKPDFVYGYTEVRDVLGDGTYIQPDLNSERMVIYAPELYRYPLIKITRPCTVHTTRRVYPNFDKEYSLAWADDFGFNNEWIESIIWFYQECLEYFDVPENVHHYSHGIPAANDSNKWEYRINHQEKAFQNYNKDGMSTAEFHAAITNAWKYPYYGDTKKFIIGKWHEEYARIIKFINETIVHLKSRMS